MVDKKEHGLKVDLVSSGGGRIIFGGLERGTKPLFRGAGEYSPVRMG